TTVQWRVNGHPVARGKGSTYVVQPGDLGRRIDVVATLRSYGYAGTTSTSVPTAVVAKAVPRITVKTKVKKRTVTVTVNVGAVGVNTSGTKVTVSVPGKKKMTRKLPGSSVSFKFTGVKKGTKKITI